MYFFLIQMACLELNYQVLCHALPRLSLKLWCNLWCLHCRATTTELDIIAGLISVGL